jgi:hypothetical protein
MKRNYNIELIEAYTIVLLSKDYVDKITPLPPQYLEMF